MSRAVNIQTLHRPTLASVNDRWPWCAGAQYVAVTKLERIDGKLGLSIKVSCAKAACGTPPRNAPDGPLVKITAPGVHVSDPVGLYNAPARDGRSPEA